MYPFVQGRKFDPETLGKNRRGQKKMGKIPEEVRLNIVSVRTIARIFREYPTFSLHASRM